MRLLTILAVAIIALEDEGWASTTFKIESRLLSRRSGGKANIFISFYNGTNYILEHVGKSRFGTRSEKQNAVRSRLIAHAEQSQVKVRDYLHHRSRTQGTEFQSLWITNQVYIKDATFADITALVDLPEVKSVTEEKIIQLDNSVGVLAKPTPGDEWNLQKIQAPEGISLWKASSPAVAVPLVGIIDSGCRQTHEALRDNWVGGETGWFDPYDNTQLPVDTDGHGTHVTGTICGKGGIGVYPDARWMACRGCKGGDCGAAQLLQCAQYMTCPRRPDGSCGTAPKIVSNSWGDRVDQNDPWFDGAIATWHSVGIIPVFAIGNSGSACGSVRSPGDRNGVIGVGSTTEIDALSTFSSVGPTVDGRIKPEISAPGSNILSAYYESDTDYFTDSGTSMACPHVSGLIAMLVAVKPTLTYDEAMRYLKDGADRNLVSSGGSCNNIPDTDFPNYQFGSGRVNALKSLRLLLNDNPFRCTVVGTFANADCRKYYRCVQIGGNLYTYVMTCPSGSYFNTGSKKCVLGAC